KKLGTCVLDVSDSSGWPVEPRCAAAPGTQAVVVGAEGRLHVCDLLTGRQRVIGGAWEHVSAGPVFSPDGRTFAVVTAARKPGLALRVIEWATGGTRHAFAVRDGRARSLAYSPDAGTLASGHEDTTVLLWDLTGRSGPRPWVTAPSKPDRLWE